jgi:flavin reductase (DIM6/NTAB) family NADH-FMN oxidoreductase RutF
MKKSIGAKTIVYPAPILVIGTYDREGKPNVMTAAWGGICCSSPPCVAVALRKATHTYGAIVVQQEFTISIPSESHVKEADYFGLVSGKSNNKFAQAGLTPVKADTVNAPYVKEFPLVLECKVIHTIEIGLHTQFIGQIMDAKVDEEYLNEKGAPDIDKIKPFLFAVESSGYYGLGPYLGDAFSVGREIQKKS